MPFCKNQVYRVILKAAPLGAAFVLSFSCGVRGRPQAPEVPAFIGRGSPQIILEEPLNDDNKPKSMPKQGL